MTRGRKAFYSKHSANDNMTAFKLFLATLCIATSNGFTTAPARSVLRPLYAEESAEPSGEDAAPEHPEDHALPSEESSDIMNSPAFLKRKVEVLESDLKKLEENMAEVNAVFEANKAEWG